MQIRRGIVPEKYHEASCPGTAIHEVYEEIQSSGTFCDKKEQVQKSNIPIRNWHFLFVLFFNANSLYLEFSCIVRLNALST